LINQLFFGPEYAGNTQFLKSLILGS
jgi:hypothetical protein